jgi:hypothetical protein
VNPDHLKLIPFHLRTHHSDPATCEAVIGGATQIKSIGVWLKL